MVDINDNISAFLRCYESNDINESIRFAKDFQDVILSIMKNSKGYEFSNDFYTPLIYVLHNEITKDPLDKENWKFISSIFCCIKNSFYQSPPNQNKVSQNDDFMRKLTEFLTIMLNSYRNGCHDSVDETFSSCAKCIVNMMAGNLHSRKTVWIYFKQFYREVILETPWEVGHLFCAVLHNFILDKEIKEEIFRDEHFQELVVKLLSLYLHDGANSCFVLFCLNECLCKTNVLHSIWDRVPVEESLLALDVMNSVLNKESSYIRSGLFPYWNTIKFFCELFKKNSDKILCTNNDKINSIEPKVVARILNFLSSAAASDSFFKLLQEDTSLLITSVYLLKSMTGTQGESNYLADLGNTLENDTYNKNAPSHPSFGFKSDLIRLIGALVFRNKKHQDIVFDSSGIELLLENSQFDSQNPFIRENAIFALRNLLEGNEENQSYVKRFIVKGMAPNPVLDEMGLQAEVSHEGKLIVRQKD